MTSSQVSVKGEGVDLRPQDARFVFDSKLNKLLSELKRIADTEPGSKSLIFSQVS